MNEAKIVKCLERFKESRPEIKNWRILRSSGGVVETDWYRDHKGEVILKIKVDTTQNPPRADVQQKVHMLFLMPTTTDSTEWAQNTKREVESFISSDS